MKPGRYELSTKSRCHGQRSKAHVEETHPYTIILRAATDEDAKNLMRVLDRALALLVRENPSDVIAAQSYQCVHALIPPPPAPMPANVLQFSKQRGRPA